MFEDKDKDFNIFPVLTNEEVNAISSFNTKQGLLENVIENLKEELSNKWKKSSPEHFKQRDWYYTLITNLDDVQKLIRQCASTTNKI